MITTFDFTQFNAFHSAASSHAGPNYSSHATSMFLLVLMHMNEKRILKSTFSVTIYEAVGLSLFWRVPYRNCETMCFCKRDVQCDIFLFAKMNQILVDTNGSPHRLRVQIWDCTISMFSLCLLGSLRVLRLSPTVQKPRHASSRRTR